MKEKHMKKWKETQQKGFARFLLVTGICSWGIPMMILTAFINNIFQDGFNAQVLLVHVLTWSVGGVLFGALFWGFMQFIYNRAVSKNLTL